MKSVRCSALAGIALWCTASLYAVTYVVPTDEALIGKARAVVVARALTSFVQDSEERGLETVTVLSVEDVLKGDLLPRAEVRVRTMGGMLKDRAKVVPGAPRFYDGERVLLFLSDLGNGNYVVTDFGLGLFGFAHDDTGREVLLRTATEIAGWDADGAVHREPRRDAEKFLGFIRGVAHQLPVKADYTVEPRPLVLDPKRPSSGKLQMVTLSYSALQYTLAPYGGNESSYGFRWNVFPSAVNWNRGNAATGLTNSGTDAINAALAAWNGDTNSNVNYVLATTNANTNGIQEAADGVSNIVFEKDLVGYADFTCAGGGVVGYGGINATSGTNTVGTETFYTTVEGDVSMNKGVGACIGAVPGITLGTYNSALTHELGHTLGFRHSNQNRVGDGACPVSYDCSTSALMTSVIPNGLNGALQTWDHSAIAALYAGGSAPSPPTNVAATGTSSTNIQVTWTNSVSGGVTGYNVYRTNTYGGAYTKVGSLVSSPYNDTVSTNKAYLYYVTAVAGAESTASNVDFGVGLTYAETLSAGSTTIKASHITELRTAASALRTLVNPVASTTFAESLVAGTTTVKASHITELRTYISGARTAMGFSGGTYSTTPAIGSGIVTADINDLRNAAK